MFATALESNGETFYHTSYAPLQNVQPTQNNYFQSATGVEAMIPSDCGSSNDSCLETGLQPYLEIIVQPCDKFRFRYRSESGSHGKLRGPAKNRNKTNFPTIKLHNYETHNIIEIRASLYTCEDDPKPHVLELVGKNCTNGACIEKLSNDNTAIFRLLEIENKRKEEAVNFLTTKKTGELELYGTEYDEEELKKQVLEELKQLNMNCAILCFEALREGTPFCKVFSCPIKNLKSTSSDLKITRISSSSGSCRGFDDIILLCDKINKEDIEIHFYLKDENDEILWLEKGIFNPKADVHHQVAIAFKTPTYKDNAGGFVEMKLYRCSDKESSEPRSFTYIPDDIDALRHSKKRKFNPAEFQNLNQASCSSEFMSSSSNSSNLESSAAALGSPSQSFSVEDIAESLGVDDYSVSDLLNDILVDGNNFTERLSQLYETPEEESDPIIDMDAAEPLSLDSHPYRNWDEESSHLTRSHYEEYGQVTYSPQSFRLDKGTIDYPCSGGGFFAFLAALTNEASSSLWNATVGRAASYMTPSLSNHKKDTKTLSHKSVPKSKMADPARNMSQSSDNEIHEQSAHVFMNDLSLQEDNKKDVKPFVSRPVRNMGMEYDSPVKVVNKTVFSDLYGHMKTPLQGNTMNVKDVKNIIAKSEMAEPATKASRSTNSNRVDLNMKGLSIQDDDKKPFANIERNFEIVHKTGITDTHLYDEGDTKDIKESFEMNKNFEHFKEGVGQVMKKLEKDVYLRYISRLMSVQDENGNLFLHLAVIEHSENVNLIARILKIAPQSVNEQNKFKETPMHLATKNNAWKLVLLLLGNGGNPSIIDVNGNNCFHIASKSNHAKSLKLILFPNLRHGKRIPSIDGFNYDGFTPLHLAVMNNARECMQLLLTAAADVNINDRISGSSAMHLAIKQQPSLISDLLSCPDINMLNPDFNDYTVVHALCAMKGAPFPEIRQSTDLIYWARKTLALPTKDAEESSSTETSSDSSDEEVDNQCATASTSLRGYSQSLQPQRINGMEENLNSLSEECENRLCRYLDAHLGWRKLGSFVDLDEKSLNNVEKLSKNSSPSKLVLRSVKKLYKNCDKKTLINILIMADLKDAIKVLKE